MDSVATILSQAGMSDSPSKSRPLLLPAEEIAEMDQIVGLSDFDDDDLDVELIEALSGITSHEEAQTDATSRPGLTSGRFPQTSPRSTSEHHFLKDQRKPLQGKDGKSSAELVRHKQRLVASQEQRDEFADKDDDDNDISNDEVTAAELEGVFAKYDKQNTARISKDDQVSKERWTTNDASSMSHKQPVAAIEVDSDDEDDFGGDSDFEQIVAEVAASQDQQDRPQTKAPVCNLHRPPTYFADR